MLQLIQREALIYSDRVSNSNKYYIIEIVYNESSELFFVIKRYGRLGNKPKITNTEYHTLAGAESSYRRELNSKVHKGYVKSDLETIMFSEGEFID